MESWHKPEILSPIPFKLETAEVLKQLHLHGDTRRFIRQIDELIDIVTPVARPKAVYKICCVDKINEDSAVIDGITFKSRVLRDNLEKVEQVFACVATCGTEVEAIQIPAQDVMRRYCLDAIKIMLVMAAVSHFRSHITQRYGVEKLTSLNPGELESFPSIQHRNLFALLGDVEGMIGVKLTENCALIPTKSHSGIYFSTDTDFISCRLCTQQRCRARRAPFNPELAAKYSEKAKNK